MLKKLLGSLFLIVCIISIGMNYYAANNISPGIAVSPFPTQTVDKQREGVVGDKMKRIALTFDDGPHCVFTEQILDILKEYQIHATFFVIGKNVRSYPALVQREITEGHELGNHTDTHPCAINTLNKKTLIKELTEAENAIYEVADYRPHLFRPPGGLRSELILEISDDMDYNIVLWSIDSLDWKKNTSLNYVLKIVRNNVKDGSIILLHDYVVRQKSVTVEALKILIPELISEGFEFVLASELISQ